MEIIETVRVEWGRAILLPYHYRRLRRGALTLGIPLKLSQEEFNGIILEKAKGKDGPLLVRFLLKEDGTYQVSTRECKKREEVRLKSVFSVKRCFSLLSPLKTSAGAKVSALALKEAQSLGYEEAITYSVEGFISECGFANIFFVKGEVLFTPSLKTGCLMGTRREFILELCKEMGLTVVEGLFELRELLKADEVFITSAREDACPVVEVDGFKFRKPKGKPLYRRIREIIEWNELKGAKAP